MFRFQPSFSRDPITPQQSEWLRDNLFQSTNTLGSFSFSKLETPEYSINDVPDEYKQRALAWLDRLGVLPNKSTLVIGPVKDAYRGPLAKIISPPL